ncbi:MAG: YfhO family protein [Thermoanaerobaculia bacterium]
MLAVLLYLGTASVLAAVAHRYVQRITLATAAALLVIPLCFTGRALLTGRVYGPVDLPFMTEPLSAMRTTHGLGASSHNSALFDIAWQMIPWRAAETRVLREGTWPLWNRYMYGGGPLAASGQPAAYSPFTLLACLLPIGAGTTYLASIWFFVAALAAFLFARELDCRTSVALFAAASWAFSTTVSFFILWPLGQAWTLAPFVLVAVNRAVRLPSLRSSMLLTIALVLLILAGHPETVLEVVFVGTLYGLFLMVRGGTDVRRAIAAAIGGGVLALLLTAIYLLPLVEALPQTGEFLARRIEAKTATGATGRDTLALLAIDFVPWLQFRMWRAATGVGVLPPLSASVGSLAVALAAFGIARVRSATAHFFAALLLLGLAAQTNYHPVARLWRALPFFDVANNNTLAFAGAMSLVVLAALGLELAAERSDWKRLGAFIAIVTIVLTAVSIAIQRADLVQPWSEVWGDYKAFAEIAAPALIVLALLIPNRRRFVLASFIVVLLAQRFVEEGDVYPVLPHDAVYPPIPILTKIDLANEPFRITGLGFAFIPATSTAYGLEDVRGYTAMTLLAYYQTWPLWSVHQPGWFNRVDDLERPFLSFLNVRYAVTSSQERDHDGWREVARQRGSKLLENTRVIERAFIPDTVVLGARDPIDDMRSTRDFRQRAWIRTPATPAEVQNGPGTLALQRTQYGYRLDVAMRRAGWIVLSEQGWRGWRAYIDHRRVKIFPANVAFLGIYVPEGKHAVDVRYWPESFVTGRAISAATLALLIAGGAFRKRKAFVRLWQHSIS